MFTGKTSISRRGSAACYSSELGEPGMFLVSEIVQEQSLYGAEQQCLYQMAKIGYRSLYM